MMRNILCKVEYDGSRFFGSQKQPDYPTVQGSIEYTLSKMLGEKIKTTFSSRTDKGVHAVGQYFNFKTTNSIPLDRLLKFNSRKTHIKISEPREVPEDFSSRFWAKKKTYLYIVKNTPRMRTVDFDYCWHVPESLNVEKIREAAKVMTGKHNFRCFCKDPNRYDSTVRIIEKIKVVTGTGNIMFLITGNSFLYNMVRIMVYSLIEVGKEKKSTDFIESMLLYCDQFQPLGKALPGGLYLMDVDFGTVL
ncbi:MAG: tRNA pseudouridine(38-40) synthase TruA [Candidatus Muiribacterium halophilum]|uniref:tRNA pseudouridine synthase A n=1 Tax=Muiribacterium halophilum TaxID=2053465 RepID=A0A2N5ZFC5_MUIH1|nr:MAG: tRNA pseudouridine(38-40) synthase TruA [Candidatus Muirbacterium halophilum]